MIAPHMLHLTAGGTGDGKASIWWWVARVKGTESTCALPVAAHDCEVENREVKITHHSASPASDLFDGGRFCWGRHVAASTGAAQLPTVCTSST